MLVQDRYSGGGIKGVRAVKIIDVHTHGIGGYDTQTADPHDILMMASIHGSHGVWGIVPTIYAASVEEMRENMAAVKEAIELQEAELLVGPNALSARILGVHLEGPFLNPARCGALDPASFAKPSDYTFRHLLEGFEDLVKIVTIAPEMEGAILLIKLISDMGIVVSMGHSDAGYLEAEAGFHAGARGITHLFNAMRGIHHREPGLAGFGLINEQIYAEVIADPFHLHPKVLKLIFRMKDPARIIVISDSVKDTYSTNLPVDSGGITDAYGTLLGGSMTVRESALRLVEAELNEAAVMRSITGNPSEYLSLCRPV